MLDECSTGTFVEEALAEKLGAKRKPTINLGTIIGDKRVDTLAVNCLYVKGCRELAEIYGQTSHSIHTGDDPDGQGRHSHSKENRKMGLFEGNNERTPRTKRYTIRTPYRKKLPQGLGADASYKQPG